MELAACGCWASVGDAPPATRIAAANQIRPAFMSDLLLKERKSVNESGSGGGIPPGSQFPVRSAATKSHALSQMVFLRRRHVEDFTRNARGGRHLHLHDRTGGGREKRRHPATARRHRAG